MITLGWKQFNSTALSILLHLVLGALLIFSFEFSKKPTAQPQPIDIVEAVAVDKRQVEAELASLKKAEETKRNKEKQRMAALETKAKAMEEKRRLEERRLLEAKRKKQQEEKQRKQEQTRLAQLAQEKQALEEKRKLEEQKLAEAKLKKQEEEAQRKQEQARLVQLAQEKKILEEKRKLEEQKIKAAEEKKAQLEKEAEQRRIAEEKQRVQAELAEKLAQEEAAEQVRKDQALVARFAAIWIRRIGNAFNQTGLPKGLSCQIQVRLTPSGEVIGVSIVRPSGNEIFDRRTINAVQKASPLPVPDDVAIFEKMFRNNILDFKPLNE